jgi:hypothetical protein
MNALGISNAFHRLVKNGSTAEQAWKRLSTALMSGDLKLWCDGNPVALDYLNANVQFIVRDGDFIAWPAGGVSGGTRTPTLSRLMASSSSGCCHGRSAAVRPKKSRHRTLNKKQFDAGAPDGRRAKTP